jgi:cytochrome c2
LTFVIKVKDMKKIFVLASMAIMAYACGSNAGEKSSPDQAAGTSTEPATSTATDPAYDAKRGVGKFTHVEISPKLDEAMAASGQKIYDVKCSSCHKLTEEKLVGPGWKGVTTRRSAEWVMNFVTNTEEMLSKDPAAQAQLELCLVRMPNQNLSDEEAMNIYEFQRKNDGVK